MAEPTQRQLRVLHSYEHYLARMRAQSLKASRAVRFAYRQLGKPYQWGGAGPRSYDCSGLVMAAWRKGGLRLPHRADLQHRMIRRKVGLKHLRPGDLVFFSGDHHVGIYVGHRQFLHAPHTGARVQRSTLTGWRLHAFAGAARPAAPEYHAWPHWVRALVAHAHAHGAAEARHPYGHGPATTPAEPGASRPYGTSPIDAPPPDASPDFGDGADDQVADMGLDPAGAPAPLPAPAPAATSGPFDGPPTGPPATPARPAPSVASARPAPSATPARPAPSVASARPAPSATPARPAPSAASARPAPSVASVRPAPSATPVRPAPSATPVRPAPSAASAPPISPVPEPMANAPAARRYAPPVAGQRRPFTPYGTAARPSFTPYGTATRRPSAYASDDLSFPLLTMAAHAPRRRQHAVRADGAPVPPSVPPPGAQTGPAPRRHWPRDAVQRGNDEQRFDRDFSDASGVDDDTDSGNDGIDLRSLLGAAP